MMNTIRNRLKKCCQRNHAGIPIACSMCGGAPGLRAMNRCTDGVVTQPLRHRHPDDQPTASSVEPRCNADVRIWMAC
jgi:hypothetical protein